MCRPNTNNTANVRRDNSSTAQQVHNIVIAGAGPAGLLLTALLMQRNHELPEPIYHITLIDGRQDLSQFSIEELKKSFRSWMLGLVRKEY
jgi:NADH dehydrogenase FAD-containing subunit